MHLLSIPRHQIQTTIVDYGRMLHALAGFGDRSLETHRFEQEFAQYVGCRHAVAVASGRLGLHLVLKHLDIQAGGEVIVPAFNYFAVVERLLQFGLRPVFADIRRENLNLDETRLGQLVSPRTRLVLATHMFGHPCAMDELVEFADRHRLVLVEDCAHALGSLHHGQHVGTFGRAGVFSFSVLKLITTFGGGMITTNDDELAGAIREELAGWRVDGLGAQTLRRFIKGMVLDAGTRTIPFSFAAWPALRLARMVKPDVQQRMMTDVPHRVADWQPDRIAPLHRFQLALGRSQLRRVEQFIEKRRQVAQWLDDEFADAGSVVPLSGTPQSRHNGMYYGILADRPDELSRYLFAHGIDSETAEYRNCAELEIYRDFRGDCPVAREVERRILRLPNHPGLTRRAVKRIVTTIRGFYETWTVPLAYANTAH